MPNLTPYTQDPTVTAIYDGIKAKHDESPRRYLGASIIGKPCARQLWYDFRWVHFEDFDGRSLRLFETGHLEEPRMVQNLRDAGVEVYDVDESTGEQFGVIFHGGHFRGHADGVALGIKDAPKTWHLLEFKTHNEKSFSQLVKNGVATAKPMHFAQMQVYMAGMGLIRAYYLAKNKNTDELYGERLHFDKTVASDYIDRAERIIFANEPPLKISEKPNWYECKFCPYSDYCHGGATALPDPMPNANCRTCIHSTPQPNGGWLCELFNTPIAYEHQLQGCSEHRYIPQLLPNLTYDHAEDGVLADSPTVFYRSGDDGYVNNGKGSVVTERVYRGEDLCTN